MTFKLHRKNHAWIRARPTIKPWQIGHLNKGRQTSKDPIVPEILKQKNLGERSFPSTKAYSLDLSE